MKRIQSLINKKKGDYFAQANSWCDEVYTATFISRNRYRTAFIAASALSGLLGISLLCLTPLKTVVPIVVDHYQDGYISVRNPHTSPPQETNQLQTQSELVRYVIARESYYPSAYPSQYRLVSLLSANNVASDYQAQQDYHQKTSPINLLGKSGKRTVHVDKIVFLDDAKKRAGIQTEHQHDNLAQVDFMVTTSKGGNTTSISYTASISWRYTGMPNDPGARWQNWNGFEVTLYQKTQRNVGQLS